MASFYNCLISEYFKNYHLDPITSEIQTPTFVILTLFTSKTALEIRGTNYAGNCIIFSHCLMKRVYTSILSHRNIFLALNLRKNCFQHHFYWIQKILLASPIHSWFKKLKYSLISNYLHPYFLFMTGSFFSAYGVHTSQGGLELAQPGRLCQPHTAPLLLTRAQ